MFIAHLPAGYVITKTLQKKYKTQRFLLIGLIASVLPDIDIVYFYLIDHGQHLHHGYWIHIPFYWLIISVLTFGILWLMGKKEYFFAALLFFSNIFVHLLLDTIVGKIEWLYPLSDKAYFLFNVPAVHDFWIYNFVFHWTFLLEIVIILWAGFIFLNKRKLIDSA